MLKSTDKTQSNKKIYTYNNKIKLNDHIKNSVIKNNTYILPKPLAIKVNNEIDNSLKNDSLATLRQYINSPKPYLVTSSIRKKIKFIKLREKGTLENFYSFNVKNYSARHQENTLLKDYFSDNSYSIQHKNKKFKLNVVPSCKTIDSKKNTSYKTNYKLKNFKCVRKNNLSSEKKINFSIFTNSKTDYSSLPTAALTSRNFYKKSKNFNFKKDINNYYDDVLGYNNANIKEPTYSKKGTIRNFLYEVDNIRKDSYKNYLLRLNEYKKNLLNENILCQIKMDERTKKIANYFLNKYNDTYNIYWYKMKKKINKEYDINDNLKYQIKSLKIDINRLTIKIQKFLIKLSIFEEIDEFLFELKEFSSYPFGTPYNQLMEVKNNLMEKIENNEEQTNLNIYLLNKNEIGLDLFINKYKNSYMNKNINYPSNKSIIKEINDFADVPEKLDSNIKKLLWKQNILEREIDSLKAQLYDILEDLRIEQLYEKRIFIRYNNNIKILSRLKTENQFLSYKVEIMKNKNKNDKYGKLNKNITFKIIQIYKNFNKNGYISEEDNSILKQNFPNYMIKYLLICLSFIEKNIIKLLKFKKEIIYKDPILKKNFELESKYAAVYQKKLKEKKESYKKIKNTIDKLNKIKYYNEQKDYYSLNRKAVINKFKKLEKEKEKGKKLKKSSVEIVHDIIKND